MTVAITAIDSLSPAEAEFDEAVSFYNTESEGLGFEFAAEVRKTIDRIIRRALKKRLYP